MSHPPTPIYYNPEKKDYWIQNSRGGWITLSEKSIAMHLRKWGFSRAIADGQKTSPLDDKIAEIQLTNDISYAGPLAGHKAGVYEVGEGRILVTTSPKIIEPAEGKFPVIEKLLTNLLGDEQLVYFYGWCKQAYESLREGKFRTGQALAIAGPADSGKSVIQNYIITPILGGRAAKCYRYMSGGTEFNGDLIGCEHLMIEDEPSSTDSRKRLALGNHIKAIAANSSHSCHPKGKQAIRLSPFWRLSLSLNDDTEALMILPKLDLDGMKDKLMLLLVNKHPLPMPTVTNEERAAFMAAIVNELPAFVYMLTQWKVPEHLVHPRFGIVHYHHPKIAEELDELSPEPRLLHILDEIYFSNSTTPREVTAETIESDIRNSKFSHECGKLFDWKNACGSMMGKLSDRHPERISSRRTSSARLWTIKPPAPVGSKNPL